MGDRPSNPTRVSIPERDFSWFQPILVLVSIAWNRFQSLKGILVDFNAKNLGWSWAIARTFQSLKGILVDFNFGVYVLHFPSQVSIPERDFSWFQQGVLRRRVLLARVSIPERDFSWFQHYRVPALTRWMHFRSMFQSLKGILVDFNTPCLPHRIAHAFVEISLVSIPERDFSWFQPLTPMVIFPDWGLLVSIPERDFSWFQQLADETANQQSQRFNPWKGF